MTEEARFCFLNLAFPPDVRQTDITLYLPCFSHLLTFPLIKQLLKLETYLDEANREVLNPVGLRILSPRHKAFLFVGGI